MSEAEVRLPRPPGVIRRALAAHPIVLDVFIVVWFIIGSLLGVLFDLLGAGAATSTGDIEFGIPRHLDWPLWPLAAVRVSVIGAALLFRRRAPLLGLIAAVVASFGDQGMQSLANGVAIMFLLYAVPVYRSVRAGWLGYVIAVVGSLLQYLWESRSVFGMRVDGSVGPSLAAEAGLATSPTEFIGVSLLTGLWLLAIVMLGINLGNRRRYLEAIIDRAHQLARERTQLAQLAVAEERSRIAREMHDIVAHSVSVMIALSEGAARAAEAAPAAAADAMQRSAETGRTALGEMRRLLGALHGTEQSAELVPQPGIQDLPDLVRSFTNAGLRVSLDIVGEASGDRGQELAVYRVVQEGLTNVLRYAGTGARASVTVERAGARTTVEVRDHGKVSGAPMPVTGVGSGRGLTGLSERARVFGGHIESGPMPEQLGGGWRLWAVLPVSVAAQEAPSGTLAGTPAETREPVPSNPEPGETEENGSHD